MHCRCQEEDVTLTPNAQAVLTSMATQTTLRYALNLISCADILTKKQKVTVVDMDDLQWCYTYFLDEKQSIQWLKEQQETMMFKEACDVKMQS